MQRTDIGKCFRIAQVKMDKPSVVIAEDFGVTKQQVHRWKHAEDMKLSRVEEFAEYFGLTTEEYLLLSKL